MAANIDKMSSLSLEESQKLALEELKHSPRYYSSLETYSDDGNGGEHYGGTSGATSRSKWTNKSTFLMSSATAAVSITKEVSGNIDTRNYQDPAKTMVKIGPYVIKGLSSPSRAFHYEITGVLQPEKAGVFEILKAEQVKMKPLPFTRGVARELLLNNTVSARDIDIFIGKCGGEEGLIQNGVARIVEGYFNNTYGRDENSILERPEMKRYFLYEELEEINYVYGEKHGKRLADRSVKEILHLHLTMRQDIASLCCQPLNKLSWAIDSEESGISKDKKKKCEYIPIRELELTDVQRYEQRLSATKMGAGIIKGVKLLSEFQTMFIRLYKIVRNEHYGQKNNLVWDTILLSLKDEDNEEIFDRAIDFLLQRRILCKYLPIPGDFDSRTAYQLIQVHTTEFMLSSVIACLYQRQIDLMHPALVQEFSSFEEYANTAWEWFKDSCGSLESIGLCDEQLAFLKMFLTQPVSALTGKGGSGKSEIMKFIIRLSLGKSHEDDNGGHRDSDIGSGRKGPARMLVGMLQNVNVAQFRGVFPKLNIFFTQFALLSCHQRCCYAYGNPSEEDRKLGPDVLKIDNTTGLRWKKCVFEDVEYLLNDEGTLTDEKTWSKVAYAVMLCSPNFFKFAVFGDLNQLSAVGPGNYMSELCQFLETKQACAKFLHNHRTKKQVLADNVDYIGSVKQTEDVIRKGGSFNQRTSVFARNNRVFKKPGDEDVIIKIEQEQAAPEEEDLFAFLDEPKPNTSVVASQQSPAESDIVSAAQEFMPHGATPKHYLVDNKNSFLYPCPSRQDEVIGKVVYDVIDQNKYQPEDTHVVTQTNQLVDALNYALFNYYFSEVRDSKGRSPSARYQGQRIFRAGMKVLCRENRKSSTANTVSNGDIMIVRKVYDLSPVNKDVEIAVDDTDEHMNEYTKRFLRCEVLGCNEKNGGKKFINLPWDSDTKASLQYGYAFTIYSTIGKGLDRVIGVITNYTSMCNKDLYTLAGRAKESLILVANQDTLIRVMKTPTPPRYSLLARRCQELTQNVMLKIQDIDLKMKNFAQQRTVVRTSHDVTQRSELSNHQNQQSPNFVVMNSTDAVGVDESDTENRFLLQQDEKEQDLFLETELSKPKKRKRQRSDVSDEVQNKIQKTMKKKTKKTSAHEDNEHDKKQEEQADILAVSSTKNQDYEAPLLDLDDD